LRVPEELLACPLHKTKLAFKEGVYSCEHGCDHEIVNAIPRFVPQHSYADSFGLQWNKFRQTQLDSHTNTTVSEDRLRRLCGGDFGALENKIVLEAGCGAGRFSEIILKHCHRLYSFDLSNAVVANHKNNGHHENFFICQANILEAPFQHESFDVVLCIGVVQHTPSPEKTIDALCQYVKQGGIIIIDHYTHGYGMTKARNCLRRHLLKRSVNFRLWFISILVDGLWWLHRLAWKLGRYQWFRKYRLMFLNLSPIVDYHDAYRQLGEKLLKEWAFLDTHDLLTDEYKHLRSKEELVNLFEANGFEIIRAEYAGNGVEIMAKKN